MFTVAVAFFTVAVALSIYFTVAVALSIDLIGVLVLGITVAKEENDEFVEL